MIVLEHFPRSDCWFDPRMSCVSMRRRVSSWANTAQRRSDADAYDGSVVNGQSRGAWMRGCLLFKLMLRPIPWDGWIRRHSGKSAIPPPWSPRQSTICLLESCGPSSVTSRGQWMTVSCCFYRTSCLMLAPVLRYMMYALC